MAELGVSVVVCTRNRPYALRGCLQSLGLSTVLPLEVIIVDQSDNELSAEIIRDCSAVSPITLRYLRMEATGHTKARNLGIELSNGDIVAFTDDDCTVCPAWTEVIAREFVHPKVTGVCGQTEPSDNSGRPREALLSTITHRSRRLLRGKHNPICIGKGNNIAVRKSVLYDLGGFNENIGVGSSLFAGDDMDLIYRLLQANGTIACVSDAVVYHWQPDDLATILTKKRGYSLSTAAILASRLRYGDVYAGALLAGKAMYEVGYLLLGGMLRANRTLTLIGWHSILGTLSGVKRIMNARFCREICKNRTKVQTSLLRRR